MPSLDLLLAFIATTALLSFIPGPAMIYTAARTMAGGRNAGLMAALGIHLGGYAHVLAAAAGLSILLHAVPLAYTAVKLAGAVYLVWLGISLFRSRDALDVHTPAAQPARKAFIESISVEVLNPKTALFVMAFLPQFVDSTASFPVWLQLALLGTIANVIFSCADVVVILLAGLVLQQLKRSASAQRLVKRAGGAVLVGLGTHLALQKA